MLTAATPIGEDDYLGHVPETPFWNEAMATMVADGQTGISAALYVSRWWRKPEIMRHMIAFALPDGRAVFSRNYGTSPDGRMPHIAGFEITPQEDGSIHYTFDGPMDLRTQSEAVSSGLGTGPTVRVSFDLVYTASLPVWDLQATHGGGTRPDPLMHGGHAEQLGYVDGPVTIDGETFTFTHASTARDHSRGVRDWSKHHSHLWLNAEFASGWGFMSFVSFLPTGGAPALNAAVVIRDGHLVPASIETDALLAPGDDIWRPFEILVTPQGMAPFTIAVGDMWNCCAFGVYDPGDLYWGVPAAPDPHAFWTTEQSGVYRVGDDVGFGRVERCNREIVADDRWRAQVAPDTLALR